MKAIICTRYGPPEVLELREVPRPRPKANEVCVRVRATAVTASDCIVRGFKFPRWHPMGLMMGLVVGFTAPRQPILGMVLAGEVEAVGEEFTRFQEGDAVYGTTLTTSGGIRFGAYAESVCLPANSLLALKPPNISFAEAAAIPYGAGIALYFLQNAGVEPGHKVLIYGASGAIGTAAVQIARAWGAEVTGVCSTANLELVRSLGAAAVIDYTRTDAPPAGVTYDRVLDAVGERKTSALKAGVRQALAPGGRYLSVDKGSPGNDFEDLDLLNELIAAGELKAVIDRSYPLEQMAEGHRYVDEGHKKGNVVIEVA